MIVSNNNNLLNILLPNDNKVLKEALKNADAQTLQKFQNGTATVGDILKNLFENLKTSDKSQGSIENFLKDTNVFKMEQNFSKSIEQVLSQLKANPSLEKFTSQIETLLKNITNLDENSLKQMIDKSGVFLESKIANQINAQVSNPGNLPKNIAELLTQIKTLIKDIPNLEAKNITNLIDKILQANSNQTVSPNSLQGELKTLVSNLQNLLSNISSKEVTNLSNLTQKLENLSSQAQLVESKIVNSNTPLDTNLLNNKEIINTKTLETLLTLKQELVNIKGIDTKPLNQLIDKLLNLQNLFTKIDLPNLNQSGFQSNFATNLDSLLTNLKTSIQNLPSSNETLNFNQSINKIIQSLENLSSQAQLVESKIANSNTPLDTNLLNNKEIINTKTLETLLTLKQELVNIKGIDTKPLNQLIDKLLNLQNLFTKIDLPNLNQSGFQSNFATNLDSLLTNLKTSIQNLPSSNETLNFNQSINKIIQSLENLSSQAQLVESKIANSNTPLDTNLLNNKEIINTKTLETLLTLKQELVNIKGIDTKPLNQLIDKLLNLQNLFTKIDLPNLNQSGFQSNFATNLDSLLTNLKTSIQNLPSSNDNLNLHQNINKTIQKLETIINNLIQNPNSFLPKESSPIQNDMKALLLQVQGELISKNDPNSQETLKQVDRLITQIEYHQLQSIVSNSNNVYIPFLWDMLDEGSISMKKINEDKFYCEINLSLKEFGETNLLLALYDKNKLDLTIYASKNSFKKSIQEALPKLRSSLNSVDLIPVNIKIVDIKKEDTKEQKQMNQFNQNDDFINPSFGVDIRV